MASILDNFKKKAVEVGNKTKDFVEINRLNMAIVQKEGEIKKEYEVIGKAYYQCYQDNDAAQLEQLTEEPVSRISILIEEIKTLNAQIMELKNEKDCPGCGSVVQMDTRFCPKCGHQFPVTQAPIAQTPAQAEASTKKCSVCNADIQADSKFCGSCGSPANS